MIVRRLERVLVNGACDDPDTVLSTWQLYALCCDGFFPRRLLCCAVLRALLLLCRSCVEHPAAAANAEGEAGGILGS